jgi:single-stranded DNA-specific DHH superfamily exonuclease
MVILKNKEDKMSESKVYIIFHSADYDGMMSATIAKMYYFWGFDVNLVPYNYGQNIDLTPMVDSTVVMVDISLAETEMIFLKEHTEKFIWIDHHLTAIEKYKHLNIEGIQGGLANRYGIYEKVIQSGLEVLKQYPNVKFLF